MHDPLVVAFNIVRPWPQRTSFPASGSRSDGVRWRMRLNHQHVPGCEDDPPHKDGPFPWWKPGSYSRFWRLAGRDYYWPALITVWHREPGGADALTVCQRRIQLPDATWRFTRGWRFHVWHWRFQIHPLQNFRRWALTRCAWCGGRSRKGDLVNFSHSWDGPRGHWWQGEPGLFHHDCSDVQRAHTLCFCADPLLSHGGYGQCGLCGKRRAWRQEPDEADRLLASLPEGSRITPDVRPVAEAAWAARRTRKETAADD